VSAKRTIMRLVAGQPVSGPELADPSPDLALQRLEPPELTRMSGQLLKAGDHQRTHRGAALRRRGPGISVDVIWHRDRQGFNRFTVP
jgi:hypothetical protein